jgi:Leucine-rich repeat (LRR) protein
MVICMTGGLYIWQNLPGKEITYYCNKTNLKKLLLQYNKTEEITYYCNKTNLKKLLTTAIKQI